MLQAFISGHFYDYENTKFKWPLKILISHKVTKKRYFKQKFQASEKYVHFFALDK